jgi:hypothetical protein
VLAALITRNDLRTIKRGHGEKRTIPPPPLREAEQDRRRSARRAISSHRKVFLSITRGTEVGVLLDRCEREGM